MKRGAEWSTASRDEQHAEEAQEEAWEAITQAAADAGGGSKPLSFSNAVLLASATAPPRNSEANHDEPIGRGSCIRHPPDRSFPSARLNPHAWRPGIGAREVHAPKAHLVDAGLLAHLLGADERRIAADDQITGKVLENFVVTEVLKHADWAATDICACEQTIPLGDRLWAVPLSGLWA